MRDAMGNELKVGDLVMLQLDRPVVFGRVADVKEGGLITGMHKGGAEARPSLLVIVSNHTVACDPRELVGSVVALRDNTPATGEEVKPAKEEAPLPN